MNTEGILGRVMLIDDERFDRMMYQRIIGRSKLAQDIVEFSYAEDALAYLADPAQPQVDLILLDINMPRMSGFEFLEAADAQLGVEFRAAVVIMLTTSLSPDDQDRAAGYPAVRGYFNKPLEQLYLDQAVEICASARGTAP